jgi:MoaA/NifB/PqqE/SkfB family radical SAM enzyme
MDCAHFSSLGNAGFLRDFNLRVEALRIPLSGSMSLTHACNIGCVHCYVGGKARHYAGRHQMSTDRVKAVLDEVAAEGCLYMLFTGGEPLLRKDFAALYTHARECGMLMTVFTNATLINEDTISLFRELPPQAIDISVYGATEETYEKISRVPGSFERCMTGIRLLHENRVPFTLKTVLMTLNEHEYHQIERLADDYGVRFRMDAGLFPRFDGDTEPLQYRVAPEVAVEKEFSNRRRARMWQKYVDERRDVPPSEKLYTCGSGVNTFHIDAAGRLQPCLMSVHHTYDLASGSFAEGWYEFIPQMREEEAPATGGGCGSCGSGGGCGDDDQNQAQDRLLSGYCPAFSRLENGDEAKRSVYLDEIGVERRHGLTALANESTNGAGR